MNYCVEVDAWMVVSSKDEMLRKRVNFTVSNQRVLKVEDVKTDPLFQLLLGISKR